MVTTLERLLLNTRARANTTSLGALKLMVIEEHPGTVFRALWAALAGRLGRSKLAGIHVERGDEIRIEGDRSSVILDGELFETSEGRSEEHTSELQSLMRISYAVFCLKKKKKIERKDD